MELERINPFRTIDKFTLDHLSRYFLAMDFARNCRCLDVASGVGFGAYMLSQMKPKEVVGFDLDSRSVAKSINDWKNSNLRFLRGDLMEIEKYDLGEFDLITSFETLEHINDYELGISKIANLLTVRGIFMGSVPGENDKDERNQYHLHHFNRKTIGDVLQRNFKYYNVLSQRFALASFLELPPLDGNARINASSIDETISSAPEDTFVFIASNHPLEMTKLPRVYYSQGIWRCLSMHLNDNNNFLMKLIEENKDLIKQNEDLIDKFTKTLGWGTFYYEKFEKNLNEKDSYKNVELFVAEREARNEREVIAIESKVKLMTNEINKLKAEIATLYDVNEKLRRDGFKKL